MDPDPGTTPDPERRPSIGGRLTQCVARNSGAALAIILILVLVIIVLLWPTIRGRFGGKQKMSGKGKKRNADDDTDGDEEVEQIIDSINKQQGV